MGRKVKTVTVTAEGRDKGKTFVLFEMSASHAEDWAGRALEAIAQNSEIPAGLINAGMFGIFILGLKPVLAAPWVMVKPLLAEMFDSCLSIQPNPKDPVTLRGAGTDKITAVGPLMEEDIEEVTTRVFLRDQILELHTGFSLAANLSRMWGKILFVAASLNTPTSAVPSEPSSPGIQA